jgi:hypothetical protein
MKKEEKTFAAAQEALEKLEKIRARVKPEEEAQEPTEERTTEEEYEGVTIRDDVEGGALRVFFRYVPGEKVRRYLKKHGFQWVPGEQCWEGERTEQAKYRAKQAIERGAKAGKQAR